MRIKSGKLAARVVTGLLKFKAGKPSPLYAIYIVTSRCNLKCPFCYRKANMHELPTRKALMAIDEVCSLGVPFFHFSGGEPMLRKDFALLAKRASSYGCLVGMSTNGTLFNSSEAFKTASEFDEIGVSLDGPAEIHDKHRGVKGTFDRAVEATKWLKASGVRVGVNTIAAPWNIEILPEFIEWLRGLVDFAIVQPIHPYPPPPQNRPPPEAVSNLLDYLLKLKRKHPRFLATSIDFVKGFQMFFDLKLPKICHAGELYVAIDPMGRLLACAARTDIALGNVLEHSASQILKEKRNSREWLKVSTCDGCWLPCTTQPSITIQKPFKEALSLSGLVF